MTHDARNGEEASTAPEKETAEDQLPDASPGEPDHPQPEEDAATARRHVNRWKNEGGAWLPTD